VEAEIAEMPMDGEPMPSAEMLGLDSDEQNG
jgi:hypothetical protein